MTIETTSNKTEMRNPRHQTLSENDESFIKLAAAVLEQSEDAIKKSLMRLREKNERRGKGTRAA